MESAQTPSEPVNAPTPPGELAGIEVPGGSLAVEQFRSGTEPVLAIHGISSQRRLWNWLRAAAPGLSLVAPDLRGRGDSAGAGSAPAYPAEAVRTFRDELDVLVTVQPVAGVDHAGSIMSPAGARAAAGLIAEA